MWEKDLKMSKNATKYKIKISYSDSHANEIDL